MRFLFLPVSGSPAEPSDNISGAPRFRRTMVEKRWCDQCDTFSQEEIT